jgi:hypothetical protein
MISGGGNRVGEDIVLLHGLVKVKRTAFRSLSFLGEGISFLWGVAKLYKMYWGGTFIIIAFSLF